MGQKMFEVRATYQGMYKNSVKKERQDFFFFEILSLFSFEQKKIQNGHQFVFC